MSFILAGILFVASLVMQAFVLVALGDRPAQRDDFVEVFWPLLFGVPLTALLVWSHWWRIGW